MKAIRNIFGTICALGFVGMIATAGLFVTTFFYVPIACAVICALGFLAMLPYINPKELEDEEGDEDEWQCM